MAMAQSIIEECVHPQLMRLLEVLPPPWRGELEIMLRQSVGVEELRLRVGAPLVLHTAAGRLYGHLPVTALCLEDLLTFFCEGALYAHRESLCQGYVTLRDGCRVGVCGRASVEDGRVSAISEVSSLCLRLPTTPPPSAFAAADEIIDMLADGGWTSSVLICAPPGAGKTTLLRALALRLGHAPHRRQTAVVDSRGELSPFLCRCGGAIDLLTGYPRQLGIEIALRTMGAEVILCDEIGSRADAEAILAAQACGVGLIATAHGSDPAQIRSRPALEPLFREGVFGGCVMLTRRPGEQHCALRIEPC